MIEGTLETKIIGGLTQSVVGVVDFPAMNFEFRDVGRSNTCDLYLLIDGEEKRIGGSTLRRTGFLGLRSIETLSFQPGDHSIGLEPGFLSSWIHYQGERNQFLMGVETTDIETEVADEVDDDEPEQPVNVNENLEWRTFSLGKSRLEHYDYENHYRIFSPTVDEGVLIAFVAYRFWVSSLQSDYDFPG